MRRERHWIRVRELLVSFFGAGPVRGSAWTQLCREIAAPDTRAVVLASIGPMELDTASRAELGEALRASSVSGVAVVTDEALVRGAMTAMRWQWSIELKMFPWHKLSEAHAYLRPSQLDARALLEVVERTRRQARGELSSPV